MATQVSYTPLQGGLDLQSSPNTIQAGRLLTAINFEQVFGKNGYRRIDGYERFDGQPNPSNAQYWVIDFTAGSYQFVYGDVIAGATATAVVIDCVVTSGTAAGGSLAGSVIVTNLVGSFVTSEAIKVAGVIKATYSVTTLGNLSYSNNTKWLNMAMQYRRNAIKQVPGSGAILGIGVFKGDVYAARNATDGKTASLYKSSPTGWVLVKSGLIPNGNWQFIANNFTGSTALLTLYMVDGKNRLSSWDGTAFTKAAPIWGTEATSTSSITIAKGAQTFVHAEATNRSWNTGDALVCRDVDNAANFVLGTVTSYTASNKTLVLNVTDIGGSGTIANWEINIVDNADRPYMLAAHAQQLFLAYPYGQLQHSDLGSPMTYTTTAGLIGMGDSITGLVELTGGVLGVFCRNTLYTLYGTSNADYKLNAYSKDFGAMLFTAQDSAGSGVFVNERGITTLKAALVFGDFLAAMISRDVQKLLLSKLSCIVGAKTVKNKNQYRVYFNDGTGLTCTWFVPSTPFQDGSIAFTTFKYADKPVCICSGSDSYANEMQLFGTQDGYVMQEESGNSFDEKPIYSMLRLPFVNLQSPSNKKRFRKLILEIDAQSQTTINFKQEFDYGGEFYQPSINEQFILSSAGGVMNGANWNNFSWSQPYSSTAEANISGVGRNMGLVLWNNDITPAFTVQGITLHFSQLGLNR